jgi:hypothetical protein
MTQLEKDKPPNSCAFIAELAGFDLSQYTEIHKDKYYNAYDEFNLDILFQHKENLRRFMLLDIGILFQSEMISWINFEVFETDQNIQENDLYKYTQYPSDKKLCYSKHIKDTDNRNKQQWIRIYL